MSPERQRKVLTALAGVFVAISAWRYLGAVTPGAPAAPVAGARRTGLAVAPVTPVDVQLEALDGARTGPEEAERNPFVFGTRAVSPEASRARPTGSAASTPPIRSTPPPGPPPLAPIPFKFIGLVEDASGARRLAVLSDSKGLVVHGTQGTIIDGRFRILSIGSESIEIAYADGRGRQTLRLTGQ
jgi:hypothetical protein